MHFEVLVEDKSGSIALDVVLGKILGKNGQTHSWRLHSCKGIGRVCVPSACRVSDRRQGEVRMGRTYRSANGREPELVAEFPGVSGRSERSRRHLSRRS